MTRLAVTVLACVVTLTAQGAAPRTSGIYGMSFLLPTDADRDAVLADAKKRLKAIVPDFKIVASFDDLGKGSGVVAAISAIEGKPDQEYLRFKSRQLTDQDRSVIQSSTHELMIGVFMRPASDAIIEKLDRLALALVKSTGGVFYDVETREYIGQTWLQSRVDSWQKGIPSVAFQVAVHAYVDEGDLLRSVTVGMSKFGLPDVLVARFPRTRYDGVGSLINLVAQTFFELRKDAIRPLSVDISTLRHEGMRASLAPEGDQATGKAQLSWRKGKPKSGDPDVLIELTFANKSTEPDARQREVLLQLFGMEDTVQMVKSGDDVLERASRAAIKRLVKTVKPRFVAGLPESSMLLVKAKFGTEESGIEWMWMEVKAWRGDRLSGVLKNQPRQVKGLTQGDTVEVGESDLFDYLLALPDGTTEGNTTGEILRRMRQR